MTLKEVYFEYNLDHISGGLITQGYCGAALYLSGASLHISLLGGALAAIHWYHGRENAQYEYWLERAQGYEPHPQTWAQVLAYLKAQNPFVWAQKWDFFAPALVTAVVAFLPIK